MANQSMANKLDTGGSHAAKARTAVEPAATSITSLPDSTIVVPKLIFNDYTSNVFNQNTLEKDSYFISARA